MFKRIGVWVAALAVSVSFVRAAGPSTDISGKKLIEFGWDEPDTAFMRKHIRQMEQTPFDGCVFDIKYKDAAGKSGSFISEAWGRRRFTFDELRDAADDLTATQFE